ncbi:GNAT family N-acetyltransferase [Emticicia sp. CRIBPO]|uniref:bifunctional helix-turn-helix transcriptional regulator/GNAT family N-acetyltransferase n=1 Tax=Emticicia sp. CRIBPO TaxID=2683258 RepID=UPI001412A7D7|nr:GNAT family N-acetyltransferase [Emticicia sp. CRIBPO]NBA86132.1 GNAT family N-acetyltransferase [Emticicia sp. CRIBPO]
MEFFEKTGKFAIGSRLRMLNEKISKDAPEIYRLFNVELQPKWFPAFHVLSQGEEKTITQLAKEIGHSHPSVSKIITEMSKKGLVTEKKDEEDKRRNIVTLTEKGREISEKIAFQYQDVNATVEEMLAQTENDLWKALGEWEKLLEQKSLLERVIEKKKERESKMVKIVEFKPEYKQAFRDLNVEWINTYFKMEAADYKALDHPEEYILSKGGYIMVALLEDVPVGVCALIRMDDDPDYDFELAKMAVSPKAQGKSIGKLLGQAIIEKARSVGASKLYLGSNSILKPAISLYHKLGFRMIEGRTSPYVRANVHMEMNLN